MKPTDPKPKKDDKKKQEEAFRQARLSVVYMLLSLLFVWVFQELVLTPFMHRTTEITYSDFKKKLAERQISEVVISDTRIEGVMKAQKPDGSPTTVPFNTIAAHGSDSKLIEELQGAGVSYQFQRPPNPLGSILLSYGLPMLLLGGFWYTMYQRSGAAMGGGIFGVAKSRATEVKPEDVKVTFKDVGGADEAIAELQEIIQFLKEPERFATLGGRIPKGVLLVGPPGTGKTLIAKATAGEARVAFFETSGSEFVEMFVGVGAARVRDLFDQARKAAPAIVFIDEIDAIGQSRAGAIRMGGNDEREQTLNQLLGEIDGFKTDVSAPVIIMAATNRPEILDPALLRAGRFDRQIALGNPDLIGRAQILKIHTKTVQLAPDFDIEEAARRTAGFSGADLANAVNEAALVAARRKAEGVTMGDFQAAIERIVAGSEKRSRVMNPQERSRVAYHESGHALVAELVPNSQPVAKISIVPHSRGALGYTMQTQTEDRYVLTKEELEDRVAVMLGGRAAEVVKFGTISTGASDDIARATELVRRMIIEFGMSERLGSVRYAGQQLLYLGGTVEDNSQLSPETRDAIDGEVRRLVTEQYNRAQQILKTHGGALEALAKELLEHETVDASTMQEILAKVATGTRKAQADQPAALAEAAQGIGKA
jgi:cell division protease FtsH